MEKWVRGLSKTTALILGILGIVAVIALYIFFGGFSGGIVSMIILGAVLGGGIGFSFPLIYKGITGQTPQERKEFQQKNK
ncbi:MAG: hypothetical protein M3R14_17180 [Acidobacteriota bacterium]|nr:hypothetical protein [Acidobacteriota bacterium]